MALKLSEVPKQDDLYVSVMGVAVCIFDRLCSAFSCALEEIAEEAYEERKRIYEEFDMTAHRKSTPSSQSKLPQGEDKLFFILRFLKQNSCHRTLAVDFGMGKSTAEGYVQELLPVLLRALSILGVLPERSFESAAAMEAYLNQLDVEELFVDASERSVQRSSDHSIQKEHYSGKKKRHTVKNTMITDNRKLILFLGFTVAGSTHDYSLFKSEFCPDEDWFKQFKIWLDLGYQGFKKLYKTMETWIPIKKPRSSEKNPKPELTPEQKSYNKDVSSKRIIVEHPFGGMKIFKVLTDTFRGRRDGFVDKVAIIAAGIWNLKIKSKLQIL